MKPDHALDYLRCPVCGRREYAYPFPVVERVYFCPAFLSHWFDRLELAIPELRRKEA